MARHSPLYYCAIAVALLLALCDGFLPAPQHYYAAQTSIETSKLFLVKGFGKKVEDQADSSGKKPPSAASIERQKAVARYDEIAGMGGQEYRIFIRQFGSDDNSWLPCGSIAVPRSAQVANAIQANIDNLKASIVRTYPKLQGQEEEFEFGYNLKIYPDDPVEVANLKNTRMPTQGLSIGNWISTLLSPIDASGVVPPPSSPPPSAENTK